MLQTNEKWWEEEKYWVQEADGSSVYPYENVYKLKRKHNIPAIVSEAERRGYERAMEEVRKAARNVGLHHHEVDTYREERGYFIPKSFFEKYV